MDILRGAVARKKRKPVCLVNGTRACERETRRIKEHVKKMEEGEGEGEEEEDAQS